MRDGSSFPVTAAHAAFRRWLFETALPFWADVGCDQGLGASSLGAHELLDREGKPGLPGFKRLRVQARQLVVFSQAALLGWEEGLAPAHAIYGFMTGHVRDGLWARRLSRDGGVLDPAADLYDLAFILLALAWYARLTGSAEPMARAERLLDWMDREMAHPAGGYANCWPAEPGWRQQNPHMHLLEALLALFETSGEPAHAMRAEAMVDLFRSRLFDPGTQTLGEFFNEDWSAADGAAGMQVEPGHQYEWIWLLSEADRLLGTDTRAERALLYGFCERHAVDAATGLVRDVLMRDGRVRQGTARLWAQTEALRAHAVMGGAAEIPRLVANLLDRYFAHPVAGAWIDQLDAGFAPASDSIPASSFYHIVTGFVALDGLVASLRGNNQAPA